MIERGGTERLGLKIGIRNVYVVSNYRKTQTIRIVTRTGDNNHVNPKCFSLIIILGLPLFLCESEHKSRCCRIHIYIAIRTERFRMTH